MLVIFIVVHAVSESGTGQSYPTAEGGKNREERLRHGANYLPGVR